MIAIGTELDPLHNWLWASINNRLAPWWPRLFGYHLVAVGEQAQAATVLDGLQGPDPGVERLFRELRFEPTEALVPERSLHDRRAF